ncbi:DUF2167 domain-containing protein [Thiolinea disciformis]|uniref:DUF2167 domain-containing protein n=1 Tax=Thiolinea disciformis TaxID=125614 RepID=UPI00037DA183|nr:DUF2167 domain-containing protein [Thiolinea disciformis]
MRLIFLIFVFCFTSGVASAAVNLDEAANAIRVLDWHVGPQTEDVASKATLNTDSTLAFLDEGNSKRFLELTGNIPESGNFVLLSTQHNWWATFSFNPLGYVKDDEKIDPDALLQQLKDNEAAANEERKRLGIPPLHTEGWYVPPHYDVESNRLEWGLKLRSEGQVVLNYTIRLLGRTGVMNATLVSNPETFDADVRTFKAALLGFEFNSGERYAEFKQGDRVAEFGLAAHIAGGAAAVATKKGFWAVIAGFFAAAWKFIAVAVVGLFAWLRSLFKSK